MEISGTQKWRDDFFHSIPTIFPLLIIPRTQHSRYRQDRVEFVAERKVRTVSRRCRDDGNSRGDEISVLEFKTVR